ncbi:MAG: ATP-dependent DNA helicase RecG, partial [Oscillospiraceae bacterium]|nr:ATP-dependent DNA helicase RecG [Oscillospiraceae bacterium]
MTLETRLETFAGIGPTRAKALKKLGLETVGDLLTYYPRDYEDRSRLYTILEAPVGEACCVSALVAEAPTTSRIRKGLSLTKCKIVDGTGQAQVTFFNQEYVRQALVAGESYIFYGVVEAAGRRRQLTNPVFEREGRARFTGRIMPVYPLTAGISNNLLAGLALQSVESCADQLPDQLPTQVRLAHNLCTTEYACQNAHFPTDLAALEVARRRLVFEELFTLSCGMAFLRKRRDKAAGQVFPQKRVEEFLALLPFTPTGAQRKAMDELARDLTAGRPMNRLIQGDVGSGKTAVAAYGAWLAFAGGFQSAMMAPTEILAHQHYETLSKLLAPAGIRVGLLTGSLPAADKKAVRAALAAGDIHLIVGTHALLSEGVEYQNLALVITDEQHRFGVGQRSALSSKAKGMTPHVLVMSATPIPRTLALLIYGDLDVTIMDELPAGRTPVETFLVGEDKRQRMYGFVRKQVQEGRQ